MRPVRIGEAHLLLPDSALADLISAIAEKSYRLIAPTLKGDTVRFEEIEGMDEMALDLFDEQAPGRYRIERTDANTRFSHVAGGSIRKSVKGRYRQWITHKRSHWREQFDAFGYVGCGRCITWCPVGIGIVAEANANIANYPPNNSVKKGVSP